MALSMGSNGSISHASAAVTITRPVSPAMANVLATAMRFSVSVPVLSTHNTVAAPRVSIAGKRRVSTPRLEIRHAPSARKTVSTTGNSSGSIAIASVTPASIPASQSPRVATWYPARATDSTSANTATIFTILAVSRCSLVFSTSTASSDWPMRPNSVRSPVAITVARPWPFTTSVPEYTAASGRFSTGSDSPVSSDSSSIRSFAATSRASAGTRSPSSSRIRSPRTTSAPAIRVRTPSRTTTALGLDRSRNASSARSERRSCRTVISITTMMEAPSIRASRTSPSNR